MTKTTTTRLIALFAGACLWAGVARADLDHIKQAAEAGDAKAQLELGILFQYGFNYKDNEIPALTWYMLSANQGNAKAASLRDTLRAKMTEKDVQEAMEQVANFKPKGQAPAAAPAPAPVPSSAPAPVQEEAPPAQQAPAASSAPAAETAPAAQTEQTEAMPAAAPETK